MSHKHVTRGLECVAALAVFVCLTSLGGANAVAMDVGARASGTKNVPAASGGEPKSIAPDANKGGSDIAPPSTRTKVTTPTSEGGERPGAIVVAPHAPVIDEASGVMPAEFGPAPHAGLSASAVVPPSAVEPPAAAPPTCGATITANVVAFDQVYTYNRFGAFNPGGMIYALKRDVVAVKPGTTPGPGNAQLRPDKRPRPIVLRVNEGDCLRVSFTNWLTPTPAGVEGIDFTNQPDKQPYTHFPIELRKNNTTTTRNASMHVNGLDYVVGPDSDDGAYVGNNASSLAGVGTTKTYTWYGAKQGQYLLFSMGAPAGNEGDNGQGGLGLFGSVNVEPKGAKWYRSQVTNAVLTAAYKKNAAGQPIKNPNGTPQINYEAKFANNDPVLNMLKGSEIIYTDVNALITGFTEDCTAAPPSGTCGKPFREFTVLFHDELKAVQAFSKADKEGNPVSPLDAEIFHGVKDGFGVNYGASGLGAILIANRKRVGPASACDDCKFEEFFLESWVNGDPAMVVKADPVTGKGVEALFPDDPSNVHHSYLNEAVRFRNVHIGAETHVFHLHAHQWLQTPRDENSTYLDSQTISPGGSFTYEINYGGSGNRNQTPGDAIFHCHLYPHFAQGMWELWRVHDVFEAGTNDRRLPDFELGTSPNPAIVPLPNVALPPMPTATFMGYPFYIAGEAGKRPPQPPLDFAINSAGKPMDGGLPRHIVLDADVIDGKAGIAPALLADPVASRVLSQHQPDPDLHLDFTTDSPLVAFARALRSAEIKVLPSDGTAPEKVAMQFHQGCLGQSCAPSYPSYTAGGAAASFVVNGLAPKPGAPYADPCKPSQTTGTREYGAAYIQFDMPVNRERWHDRQARIMTLENDAIATRDGRRKPEPLYFRANSGECVVFRATNLIPKDLNLDDFQIFTPTDIMGQHIHLVKFDVTSSDGAGNGWNYEDGTFSPGEVQERIEANNTFQEKNGGKQIFEATIHPKFGTGPDIDNNGVGDYVGAQTTIQRWWADPLLNTRKLDRTIRTVFTHDHFGPSSHQHHGFYGALVVERATAKWTALNGGQLGGRDDGGPTSFAANILDGDNSFREYNLAFADFAIVYRQDLTPVNPPGRKKVGDLNTQPWALEPPDHPEPEAISADDPGTQLINYRNEPIPHRIRNASTGKQYPTTNPRGDVANVFSSWVHGDPYTPVLAAYEKDQTVVRLVQGAQEEQHVFNLHGYKWFFQPGTPDDPASVNNSGYRNGQQIGISEHFEFYLNQPPPDYEAPDYDAEGKATDRRIARKKFTDHLYSSAATDNLWDGQWGILRVFKGRQPDPAKTGTFNSTQGTAAPGSEALISQTETEAPAETLSVPDPSDPEGLETIELARLPNNPTPPPDPAPVYDEEPTPEPTPIEATPIAGSETATSDAGSPAYGGGDASMSSYAASGGGTFTSSSTSSGVTQPVCTKVTRKYSVNAILARDAVPGGQLVYNKRAGLVDPNAILLVNNDHMADLKAGLRQPEPLILRANAGECMEVTLTNKLPTTVPENLSWNLMPMIVNKFNFNQVRTSNRVGLHSQLVAVNTYTDDGANVGFNKDSTVGPGGVKTYRWYTGDRYVDYYHNVTRTPVEFGATGIRDMGDAIKHASHASIGSLIVEPPNTTWTPVGKSEATADIRDAYTGNNLFREFVTIYQTDLSLQQEGRGLWAGLQPLRNIDDTDDSEDSGMKAFNYKTEPLWARLGVPITTPPIGGGDHPPGTQSINDFDLTNILSSKATNPGCGGACGDPETPVFTAVAGTNVRFRVLDVAGHPRQHGFTIFGHHWQFEPWQNNSRTLGFNPRTFDIGSESGIAPTRHVNILTNAGGLFAQPGDYLYRTQESFNFSYGGLWGIFRVVR